MASRPNLILLALAMLVATVGAGCASPEARPAAEPSSVRPTVADLGNESSDVGTLEGLVTDDELVPIPNASIALARLGAQVASAADGKFRFENVPVGKHALVAQALGYETASKTVEVVLGEVARVDLVLTPVPVLEPYMSVVPHSVLVHVGGYPTAALNNINQETACTGCLWIPTFEKGPTYVFVEVYGKHTVPNAHRPDGFQVAVSKRVGASQGPYVRNCDWIAGNRACLDLPIRFGLNGTDLDDAAPKGATDGFQFWQFCDPTWFCVEERYEEWMTLFYNTPPESIPKDYSARPA